MQAAYILLACIGRAARRLLRKSEFAAVIREHPRPRCRPRYAVAGRLR